ncbi:MAG: T9SS type A sorting domain-containing protein [Bacteroidota bacterium]
MLKKRNIMKQGKNYFSKSFLQQTYLILAMFSIHIVVSNGQPFINEDFSTASVTTPPAGWTINIIVGDTAVDLWHFDNPGSRTLNPPITSPAAIFDSDNYSNNAMSENVGLESPAFDASLSTMVYLEWDEYFNGGIGAQIYVEVFDGIAWNQVYYANASTSDPNHNSIDISAYAAGVANAQVRFRWLGNWAWYWIVDNVIVRPPYPDDVGIIAFTEPMHGCSYSATENVTVLVENSGSAPQSGIPVSYRVNGGLPVNDTINLTINPGDTASFTFTATTDLTIPGIYILDAWTSLGTDPNIYNDSTVNYSLNITAPISSFPFFEDFETFTPGTPGTLLNGWFNDVDDDFDWYVNSGTTPTGTSGPAGDKTTGSGNYMFTESSTPNYPNKTALLLSPCLDISSLTLPELSFWYHMYGGNMGALNVDIDSGGVWTNEYIIAGQQQLTDTAQWKREIIDLSSYSGTIRIRFRGVTNGWTSDMAIDDIKVDEKPPDDVGVVAIEEPNSGCSFSSAETVTVSVRNFGTVPQSNVPVSFRLDGGITVNETISNTIDSGETVSYTFTATADMSAPGIHLFDAWTSLVVDGDVYNDSTLDHPVYSILINSFPYSEDFETFTPGTPGLLQNGWNNALGDDFDWSVSSGGTSSAGTGPAGDHTTGFGNYLYTESSAPNYSNKTAELLSPCFDLDSLPYGEVSFWYHMYGEYMGNLFLDVFSGGSWTLANAFTGQQHLADTVPWSNIKIDLDAFSGIVQFRFRGETDLWTSDMALDDFGLNTRTANDVGVIAIDEPVSAIGLSATESVTVRIKNFGSSSQSNIPVFYRVDGGAPFAETYTSLLNPGDTGTYTFSSTFDLSLPENYIFDAWTELSTDTNNINDSITGKTVLSSTTMKIGYLQKVYGGDSTDYAMSVQQTTDGGYIIAGTTFSFGSGKFDMYLVKTDGTGNIMWAKTYGDYWWDWGYSVQQTTDGGYIVGGTAYLGPGGYEACLIKTDANGNILWTKTYGGATYDYGYSVLQTFDGGYAIAGKTDSYGAGSYDFYIIRTDPSGNMLWTRTFGRFLDEGWYDDLFSIQQTADSGFVMVGSTESYAPFGPGGMDVYMIKTDSEGNLLWSKIFGGTDEDYANSVKQTSDNGYIIAGYTWSFGAGWYDVYLIRTDAGGDTLWTRTYGNAEWDKGHSVLQTTDGGFIVAGSTGSFGAGNDDVYLIKTDANGDTVWTKTYGGAEDDQGWSVINTADGGYVIAGYTESFGEGGKDFYFIKTDAYGNSGCNEYGTSTIVGYPATMVYADVNTGSGGIASNPLAIQKDGIPADTTLCSKCAIPASLCIVTVDSSSSRNIIVWEKPVTATIESFKIYRDIVGTYTFIGSVPYNSLSEFVDTTNGVNPQITSYRYKIATVDTCGFESELSDYHETMHVTSSLGVPPPTINLIWDPYEGFPFSYYRILRDSTGGGNFELIDSVASTNFTYSDQNVPSGANIYYMVEVVHPDGCTATLKGKNYNSSKSNTTVSTPIGINENPHPDYNLDASPNPNHGKFAVTLRSNSNVVENETWMRIYNMLGQEIKSVVIPAGKGDKTVEIDMRMHQKGVYQLNVITDKFNINKKIVIE